MEWKMLVENYKHLEKTLHISFDEVLHKVTQEVWEIIEASEFLDPQEMYKEAGDALVNVLSASSELGFFPEMQPKKQKDPFRLIQCLGKWNATVLAYQERYSKKTKTLEELQSMTQDFVAEILAFWDPCMTWEEMVERNYQKFLSRKDLYLQKIDLKTFIDECPDFPKKWIQFKDISPILANPKVLNYVIDEMSLSAQESDIIAGFDARGFLFWILLAQKLSKPFVMLRKAGKLPWPTQRVSYWLEYGENELEIQSWKILPWQKVTLVDDLLATWGTMQAGVRLVEQAWGVVDGISVVVSLDDASLLNAIPRNALANYRVHSCTNYQ